LEVVMVSLAMFLILSVVATIVVSTLARLR
jgi:hypothetical protein